MGDFSMTPTYLAAVAAQHGLDPEKFAEAVKQIQSEQDAFGYVENINGEVRDFAMFVTNLEIPKYPRNWTQLFAFPPAAQVPPGWTIERADKPPFKRILVKAPNGYGAVVDSMALNPENVLYMLADALLSAAPEYKEETIHDNAD